MTTKCCEYLSEKRRKFYGTKKREGGEKKIPDIEFSPTVFKYWYIGDGTLGKERKNAWRASITSTQYSSERMRWVSRLLAGLGMNPRVYEMKDGRTKLDLSGNSEVRKFLEFIGDCPVDCYKYKWGDYHIKEAS